MQQESAAGQLLARIAPLEATAAAVSGQLEEHAAALQAQGDALSEAGQRLETLEAAASEARSQMTSLAEAGASLEARAAALEAAAAEAGGCLSTHQDRIGQLEGIAEESAEQLATLAQKLEAVGAATQEQARVPFGVCRFEGRACVANVWSQSQRLQACLVQSSGRLLCLHLSPPRLWLPHDRRARRPSSRRLPSQTRQGTCDGALTLRRRTWGRSWPKWRASSR